MYIMAFMGYKNGQMKTRSTFLVNKIDGVDQIRFGLVVKD